MIKQVCLVNIALAFLHITQGKSIGDCDTMIAALGLQHNNIVVTNNVKHFQRVKNLVVINWRD